MVQVQVQTGGRHTCEGVRGGRWSVGTGATPGGTWWSSWSSFVMPKSVSLMRPSVFTCGWERDGGGREPWGREVSDGGGQLWMPSVFTSRLLGLTSRCTIFRPCCTASEQERGSRVK